MVPPDVMAEFEAELDRDAAAWMEANENAIREYEAGSDFAEDDEQQVAVPGREGDKAESLLAKAKAEGIDVLTSIARRAVKRLLSKGARGAISARSLFTPEEIQELADALAATAASASLLGRARIRERQEKAEAAQGSIPFTEIEAEFERFDEAGIPLLSPSRAIEFFRRLIPGLAVDPDSFLQSTRRQAFELAVTTQKVILGQVKEIIAGALERGDAISDRPAMIRDVLDQAGLSYRNPQYPEMVFRTNMMDAYNAGADEERQSPDVVETFPVWQYVGIDDERAGDDHRPHFGKYYPASVDFATIRDSIKVRPFNCRCTSIPVSKWDWEKLYAGGARIADGYPQIIPSR